MRFFLKLLASLSATLAIGSSCLAAGHQPPNELRAAINSLPPDSETLMVWQSFKLPERNGEPGRKRVGIEGVPGFLFERVQGWSLLPIAEVDDGSLYDLLAGRSIKFALEGARNFRPAQGNTSYLFDGCHLIRFEQPITNEFKEKLAQVRSAHYACGDVDVAVCKTKWGDGEQEVYAAMPQPDLLLLAMDKTSAEAVLAKLATPEADKSRASANSAFPPALCEWKFTDTAQKIWGLRHFCRKTEDNRSPFYKSSGFADDQAVGATVDCIKTADSPCGVMNVRYLTKSSTLPWPRLKDHDPTEVFEHKGICWTWKHTEHSEIGEAVEWYLGLGLIGHTIND